MSFCYLCVWIFLDELVCSSNVPSSVRIQIAFNSSLHQYCEYVHGGLGVLSNYYWYKTRVILEILSVWWQCMMLPLNHKVYWLTTLKTMVCICIPCQFKTMSPSSQTYCSFILIACDLYPITWKIYIYLRYLHMGTSRFFFDGKGHKIVCLYYHPIWSFLISIIYEEWPLHHIH